MGSKRYFLRMKYLILFTLISLGTCTTILRYDHESQWQEYKLTYKKEYKTSNDELKRKAIFMSNVEQIEKHNLKFEQGLSTYKQGVNAYSDWTWEEFQDRFLLKSENDTLKGYKCDREPAPEPNPNTPKSKDWRSIMNPPR